MYNIDTCAICRETLETSETRVLPCNHSYHKECIDSWLVRVPSCPYCRTIVVIEGVTPVDTDSAQEDESDNESFITQNSFNTDVESTYTDTYSQSDAEEDNNSIYALADHPDVIHALRTSNYHPAIWTDFSENYELSVTAMDTYMCFAYEQRAYSVVNNFIICQQLSNEFILKFLRRLDYELLLTFQADNMATTTFAALHVMVERGIEI